MKACPKSTQLDEDKCKQALQRYKKKKEDWKEQLQEVRVDVSIIDDHVINIDSGKGTPHWLGPMDQFARSLDVNDFTTERHSEKKKRQLNINDSIFKTKTNEFHSYLALGVSIWNFLKCY